MVFSNYDEGRESGITHTENVLPFMLLTGKGSILIKQRAASEKLFSRIFEAKAEFSPVKQSVASDKSTCNVHCLKASLFTKSDWTNTFYIWFFWNLIHILKLKNTFSVLLGYILLSGGSDRKESACNVRDLGSIPGLGISPGEGNGHPLQYSCLESPMKREV